MKSIFEKAVRDELIGRINSLNENSTAQWGKMTVSQMLKHCTQWDEMAFGKQQYKQSFIGKLFGKIALKDMLKDEPIKRNLPTVPSFKIKDNSDFNEEKVNGSAHWRSMLILQTKDLFTLSLVQ